MTDLNEPTGEYEDVTEKEILVHIAAQLDAIRRELEGTQSESDMTEPQFECVVCNDTVAKSTRKDHAKTCFGWHKDMGKEILKRKYECK